MQGAGSNPKTGNTMKRTGTTQTRGQHNITPSPPFNRTTTQTEGGHHTQDGETSNTADLHSPYHPPSAMPPHHPRWPHPPPRRGGERTEDTPPHEHHRHTPTTHTPHTRQGAVHDMTAVLASTAMGRVGHEPHHCTGQDSSSTPPPFHTPRRMDTIHSPTHLLLLIRVHTLNEQQ